MIRRIALLTYVFAYVPTHSFAAEITRIASSAEENNPFGMFVDLQYELRDFQTNILREVHQNGGVEDFPELVFKRREHLLQLDLRVGLYRDLEFKFQLPISLRQNRSWNFHDGTDATNSTIVNNCLAADGSILGDSCGVDGTGREAIFPIPYQAYRAGLDNMTFGLAYALLNQKKTPHWPTWVVSFDYVAPTAPVLNPSFPTSRSSIGSIGDGFHRYRLSTAFSKRLGKFDPYFQVHYTLPWRGARAYSNCDSPNASLGRPENCGKEGWGRAETLAIAPHIAGVVTGSEYSFFDDKSLQTKVAADIRVFANFVSEGRYYNEMSDVFGKLLKTQEYLQVGTQLGIVAYAADYLHFRVSGAWSGVTDHFLTNEDFGKDLNGSGSVDLNGTPSEINPLFDWRADMVSRRFRTGNAQQVQLNVAATVAF